MTAQTAQRPVRSVSEAADHIRDRTFGPLVYGEFRIGIEAEFIPIRRESRGIAAIEEVLPVLDGLASETGGRRMPGTKGAPVYELGGGGRLTFEPGGQLEYASPPHLSPSAALTDMRSVLLPLTERLGDSDIDLHGVGIDPFNGPANARLQVDVDRYRRMDAYYARYGPAGARMMRQTASIQIGVDPPGDRGRTWKVLNALAPVLVAMFANSRLYGERDTGFASFRSWTWQTLDRTRTGLPWSDREPADHYAAFALDAPAMFIPDEPGEYKPFRTWVERGGVTGASIDAHLSSLFPDVRPRRYFEVRSIDGLPLSMYAAPVMVIAGLALDPDALMQADRVLGEPDTALLNRAARSGLRDAVLFERANAIARLAVTACRQQPDLCNAADVDAAEEFFRRFTERGRSPADTLDARKPVSPAA